MRMPPSFCHWCGAYLGDILREWVSDSVEKDLVGVYARLAIALLLAVPKLASFKLAKAYPHDLQ